MSAPDLEPCCYAATGSHEVFCPIGSDKRVKASIEDAYQRGFKAGQERMRERAAQVLPDQVGYRGDAERIRALPIEEPER